MIGTKVKGFRHLSKMAKTFGEVSFFYKSDGGIRVSEGVAIYISREVKANPYFDDNGDYVLFFTHHYNCLPFKLEHFASTPVYGRLTALYDQFHGVSLFSFSKPRMNKEINRFLVSPIALPSDFDKQYELFCQSNKTTIASVVGKLIENPQSIISRYMFMITNGSKNFYSWGLNAVCRFQQSIHFIDKIMLWDEQYGKMANKLSKGSITAYTGKNGLFGLLLELYRLRRDKRANDVINTFNTAQKKALKSYKLTERDYKTLSRFAKLSGKKKGNFIKKMSSVEDVKEILRQMAFLADIQFEWNKESFIDYLKNNENLSFEIMLDRDHLMVLKVNDYETIKRLTKSTNWCISKDKKYWTEYVENRKGADQYVIFDFSRREDDNLSIVGFTCDKKQGITHSHDFQNRNLMEGRQNNRGGELKTFARKVLEANNIFSVLDLNSIDISLFLPTEKSKFEWTRDGIFSYLLRCIDAEDFYVIADLGDKFAFICENRNIKYFFGDKYVEMLFDGLHSEGSEYIIFIDLNKSATDRERMIFGVIDYDYSKCESTCNRLYNANCENISISFNQMISKYGLPYDIICRSDDITERFYQAYRNVDMTECRELVKNEKVKEMIKNGTNHSWFFDKLNSVSFNYHTCDYLDLIYNVGATLVDVVGASNATQFANTAIRRLHDYSNHRSEYLTVPTVDEIKLFESGQWNGSEARAYYIGYFTMLMKIIEHEASQEVLSIFAHYIVKNIPICQVTECILTALVNKFDFDNMQNTALAIIKYAYKYNSHRLMKALQGKKSKFQSIENALGELRTKQLSDEIWVKSGEANTFVTVNVSQPAVAH